MAVHEYPCRNSQLYAHAVEALKAAPRHVGSQPTISNSLQMSRSWSFSHRNDNTRLPRSLDVHFSFKC